MRTKSIISIIRKYGLSSKRLNPKHKIKYEDAIKSLEGYENSELKIAEVIDNVLYPHRSISCQCQIPGCNHRIRYEYVLENKTSHQRIVAGSTCVWPTLGLSELEKKDFMKYEKVVKEYHDMIVWRKENQDVWDILMRLKDENFTAYKPFWKEVESCRLTDEDTEYIRGIDVDKLIQKREEKDKREEELRRMTAAEREKKEAEYKKVIDGLYKLINKYPENSFYLSLVKSVKHNIRLTDNQIKWIKIGCNKMWYEENIKGTSKDIMDKCEEIITPVLEKYGYRRDEESIKLINDNISGETGMVRLAWNLFKVKENLVL